MSRLLIIYSSRYGQTRKIAERLAQDAQTIGVFADAVDMSKPFPLPLEDYNGVLIGTSIYMGRSDSSLMKWVLKNKIQLNRVSTGLFTVSLNAADSKSRARSTDSMLIQDFIDKTGLVPAVSKSFAGALRYSAYNPFIRFIMKRISKSVGGPTDTSIDHELTDWNDVDLFLKEFLKAMNEINLREKHFSEARPELF